MANYRKSFNLRNGVQIDDDNFIVNANGLVGIGTSIPTEFLDVKGNAKISGLVVSNNANIGIATVGFLTATQGISVSGVVTANAFYGDGSTLSNIVGYSTAAWILNIDKTGISTTLNVGIGTTVLSAYSLLIGSDPLFGNGISFNGASGNVRSTGILTSYSFSGFGTDITGINASNISNGTLSNSLLPSNISVSGVITATNGFKGDVTGTASTSLSLSGIPNITVTDITASNYNSSGILTTGRINSQIATISSINSGFSTSGITTIYTALNVASLGTIGVGTNNPNADIHIVDGNDGSSIQLTSTGNNEAYVSIGRSITRNGNNGELRFGNTNSSYFYSNSSSLDVINYGIGNINNYLQLGSAGVGTGSFNWFNGQFYNTPLMTLTYGGRLGLGVTLPNSTLHVVGTSTVTGNSYIDGNCYVSGNLSVGGLILSVSGIDLGGTNLIGNVIGNLTGNVNSTTGISTFNQVQVNSNVGFSSVSTTGNVGIRTLTSATYSLVVNPNTNNFYTSNQFIINDNGGIGIGTNSFNYAPSNLYSVSVDAARGVGYFQGLGIGTITPSCFADFSAAGYNHPTFGDTLQFMIPPKVTTTQRNALSVVEGGLIYNTTNKRLEIYNGIGWSGIATVP